MEDCKECTWIKRLFCVWACPAVSRELAKMEAENEAD